MHPASYRQGERFARSTKTLRGLKLFFPSSSTPSFPAIHLPSTPPFTLVYLSYYALPTVCLSLPLYQRNRIRVKLAWRQLYLDQLFCNSFFFSCSKNVPSVSLKAPSSSFMTYTVYFYGNTYFLKKAHHGTSAANEFRLENLRYLAVYLENTFYLCVCVLNGVCSFTVLNHQVFVLFSQGSYFCFISH